MIRMALKRNFVFADFVMEAETGECLPEQTAAVESLISAFESCEIPKGAECIIKQGDPGDYFYIIREGAVVFELNGQIVGRAKEGQSFGELALLYTCPRAATVRPDEEFDDTTVVSLFRLDQTTFRYILQAQTQQSNQDKLDLLKKVTFFKDLSKHDIQKLAKVMTPRIFQQPNEIVFRKGDTDVDNVYIIQHGTFLISDICAAGVSYSDLTLNQPGDFFGERAILSQEPRAATVTSLQPGGVVFTIGKRTFEKVLGKMSHLILSSRDSEKIAQMKLFQQAFLDADNNDDEDENLNNDTSQQHHHDHLLQQCSLLAKLVTEQIFLPNTQIMKKGENTEIAIYFIREGKIELTDDETKQNNSNNNDVLCMGMDAFFGEELFLEGANVRDILRGKLVTSAPYSVKTLDMCVCGVLTLEDVSTVVHISGGRARSSGSFDSAYSLTNDDDDDDEYTDRRDISLDALKRHRILGEGTFGQVWLVSEDAKVVVHKKPFALKIQSKYDLVQEGQVESVLREKEIMMKIRHPFSIQLVQTYQDQKFIYMLEEFIQGGELFSIIHDESSSSSSDSNDGENGKGKGLSEEQARFYALALADVLAYLHRRKYVFRDLKPENVMIDHKGYPVLIDYGFAKCVPDKTYTLCGTPAFLAPEVILQRGYDSSADHWSYGVLLYVLFTGENPFYFEGMDQMSLFEGIIDGTYNAPPSEGAGAVSPAATDLLTKLLETDPLMRLGSLARGELDILRHEWFHDMDIHAMRERNLPAPWVPSIKDPMDTSHFDDWSNLNDKTAGDYGELNPKEQALFKDF